MSIITAVLNRSSTIECAIQSVRSQVYRHREHIVIDGASTDGTLEILQRSSSHINVLVSESDSGIYDALNKGIGYATGDVIGFLHADDLYESEYTVSKIADMFTDPSVNAVYGDLVYVDRNDPDKVVRYWRAGKFSLGRLKWGWMPPHPTLYVRREIYERLGRFDTSYRISSDYDCMLRLFASRKLVPKYIPETLVRMRVGGASNRSVRQILRKSVEDYRALRSSRLGGVGSLLWKNLSKIGQFRTKGMGRQCLSSE